MYRTGHRFGGDILFPNPYLAIRNTRRAMHAVLGRGDPRGSTFTVFGWNARPLASVHRTVFYGAPAASAAHTEYSGPKGCRAEKRDGDLARTTAFHGEE